MYMYTYIYSLRPIACCFPFDCLLPISCCVDTLYAKVVIQQTKSAYSPPSTEGYADLRKMPQSANSLVIYASAEGTEAFAGPADGLSTFTREFVQLIPQEGLEIGDLLKYVRIQLSGSGAIPHEEDGRLGYFHFTPKLINYVFIGNPAAKEYYHEQPHGRKEIRQRILQWWRR